ncbi:MAG: PepSY domain-containing protein [Saprospiraceae bacterium]|nr:PepSY domain-containing protein [Saprospiraceae bacterium]
MSDKARQGKDLLTQSYAYLNAVKTQIKVQNPESEFVMTRIDTDEFGGKHIRFDQQYNGIKIYGSELLLHTNRDKIDYLNGRWKKSLEKFEVNPSISEATALALISESEKFMPLKDVMGILGDRDPKSELTIYYHDKKPVLTYHITAYPDNLHRWEYFIDAHSGKLINKYVNSCKLHNHGSFGEIIDELPKTLTIADEKTVKNSVLNGHIAMQGTDLLGVSRSINSLDFNGVRYLIDVNRPMFVTTSALPNDPDGTIWTIDAKTPRLKRMISIMTM